MSATSTHRALAAIVCVAFGAIFSSDALAGERLFGTYYCSGCRGPLGSVPTDDLRDVLVRVWDQHDLEIGDKVKVCGPVDCVVYTLTDNNGWSDGARTPYYPSSSGGGSETSPNPANPHPG
ncbi:MAG TPA: hypothetical protein VJ724_12260, partial [Tahibacter sp.]|nr:hypothetical protein [Tahibacter sp.]